MNSIKSFCAASAISLAAGAGQAATVDLLGETLDMTFSGCSVGCPVSESGFTVGGGVEIVGGGASGLSGFLFRGEAIDFGANDISLTFTGVIGGTFSVTGYSGVVTGLSEISTTAGEVFSLLSIAGDGKSFDFNVAADSGGGEMVLGVEFADVSQVPLPAGVVLLLTGMAGLSLARRRGS